MSQGTDAAKKIVGRKRSIVIDTLGLLLAMLVTAASVPDSVAGTRLVDQVAAAHPTIRKAWVDGGYRQHLVEHAAGLGIDMEIVQRPPATKGFTSLPRRWAVERTRGWLMFHRRLARDYETLPARSEAMIHLAMTDLMARRLTSEATPPPPSRSRASRTGVRDVPALRATSDSVRNVPPCRGSSAICRFSRLPRPRRAAIAGLR